MKQYTPPNYPNVFGCKSIFLAGSIEMGKASNWQSQFISYFDSALGRYKIDPDKWIALNPRRQDWDITWDQSINNPHFYQQVDWELTYLERAKYRVFFFEKDTMSPVSLLELGKFGDIGNNFIVVENGYSRKGNVDIFCHRYQIPQYDHLYKVIQRILDIEYLRKRNTPPDEGDKPLNIYK